MKRKKFLSYRNMCGVRNKSCICWYENRENVDDDPPVCLYGTVLGEVEVLSDSLTYPDFFDLL